MNNIVFDRLSLKCIGINRDPLPFEFQVNLPYGIQTSKNVQELTGGQIQKVNQSNNPLFKTNIQTTTDEFNNEITTWEETTSPQTPISFQTVTNTYRVATEEFTTETIINEFGEEEIIQVPIYETITTTSEIPLETIELEPVLVEEFVNKTYTLENGYMEFDYYEILEAKKQAINNNSLTSICYFDEDFLDSNLTLNGCSIGDGVVILHSGGALETPSILLPKSTNIIEIYQESQNAGLVFEVNDVEVSNGRVKLSAPTNEITIKISNPTSKNLELYALGGMC